MAHKTPIAERLLRRVADGLQVSVQLFAPYEADGQWECEVRVSGLELSPVKARGVDSLQALTEGFNAMKAILAKHARTLTWFSGVPGDNGLPTVLPYEDIRLANLMDTLADAERQRFYLYAKPFSKAPKRRRTKK